MDNRVALITGGTRGIGKGIAQKMVEEGYCVVVIGTRDESFITEALDEIRRGDGSSRGDSSVISERGDSSVIYIKGNISQKADREKIIEKCMDTFGRIDVLVNNAGVAPKVRMDILDTTEESMDYVLDINLKGTFFLTQLAAKAMIESVRNGIASVPKIINISSISAYTSSVNRAEYCISKAGLSMMTKLFADKLADYGIYVYEIRPGVISTDMTEGVKEKYDNLIKNGFTPIKRWGYPADVADAVLALCSDSFLFSTGEVINVDGGFHLRRL